MRAVEGRRERSTSERETEALVASASCQTMALIA